jgi:hypothetical protein
LKENYWVSLKAEGLFRKNEGRLADSINVADSNDPN